MVEKAVQYFIENHFLEEKLLSIQDHWLTTSEATVDLGDLRRSGRSTVIIGYIVHLLLFSRGVKIVLSLPTYFVKDEVIQRILKSCDYFNTTLKRNTVEKSEVLLSPFGVKLWITECYNLQKIAHFSDFNYVFVEQWRAAGVPPTPANFQSTLKMLSCSIINPKLFITKD